MSIPVIHSRVQSLGQFILLFIEIADCANIGNSLQVHASSKGSLAPED